MGPMGGRRGGSVHRSETRDVHTGALSERELDVLEALANGESGPDAARRLGISHSTLRDHLIHAMFKLGAHDRPSAMALAARLGLVASTSPTATRQSRVLGRPARAHRAPGQGLDLGPAS